MNNVNSTMITISIVVMIIVFFMIFRSSLRFILKLLMNTLMGFFLLFLFDKVGAFIGVYLAINWVNAIVTGILGVPGLALLLVLQWMAII